MIRREMTLPGREKQWALISQVEHAHLAADLARHWRAPLVPPAAETSGDATVVRQELLAAVQHHDDGWAEWEEAPDIDPEHGRPRSFLEMPQVDSLAIWSKSIAVAERIGPLAAWVVAGHFAALLKTDGETASEGGRPATEWNELMRARRAEWLQAWLEAAPGRTQEMAEWALRALQFFDAASLWFCCSCPPQGPSTGNSEAGNSEASVLTLASAESFRFTPGEDTVSIEPWPLYADELRLVVHCHVAPIERYQTADDLLQAWRPHRLVWRLRSDWQAE